MANPNVAQGTLNRLRASVVWPGFPELNVTAPFLGKEGIRLTFEGESTVFIDTMTGAVTSPEPYLKVSLRLNLLKTQQLANLYKAQMELSSLLGDGVVRADALALGNYPIINCAIESTPDLNFAGDDAAYNVNVRGYYNINSALWNL